MKEKRNSNKAITLIALVVTIVVLLILAGVSISMLGGESGIIKQAQDAKHKTMEARAIEVVNVEVIASFGIDGNLDYNLLNENLKHIENLIYNGGKLSDINKITSLPTTVIVDGFSVIINENGNTLILGDIPEHPELSGYDWFIVGETEPDEQCKDIAQYFVNQGQPHGTLIIYPRNGKYANIDESLLEKSQVWGMEAYLPEWSPEINSELGSKITSVYVAPGISAEYVSFMFALFENCKKIDISNLETSKVTDLSYMFLNSVAVTQIIGSENLVTSNVTNVEGMFNWCEELTYINTTDWDVSNVQNMDYLFCCCFNLETIDGLSGWDVSNVISMTYLFDDCHKLDNINLSKWDVSNVQSMWGMFLACKQLETMDWISNWDVSNVQDFTVMFEYCESLVELNLSNWDVSSATSFRAMFDGNSKLEKIGDISNWDTSNVTDMMSMFKDCEKISASIIISSEVEDYKNMFKNCSTVDETKFIVNYKTGFQSLAQAMVDTNNGEGNVVLGIEQ